MRRKPRNTQCEMSFGRGGWRPGAGRPVTKRRNKIVLHRKRPEVSRRTPAHVTLKVRPEVANLRTKKRVKAIRAVFVTCCNGVGFRIIDWSIQSNHMHLIAEADDRQSLSKGMQRFCIRVARRLNSLAGRKGTVFKERYHLRLLKTPAEVRNCRAYVVNNHRRHAVQRGQRLPRAAVDPCSSWAWFDGWQALPTKLFKVAARERQEPSPVSRARGWILRVGWRKRGLVRIEEVPKAWTM